MTTRLALLTRNLDNPPKTLAENHIELSALRNTVIRARERLSIQVNMHLHAFERLLRNTQLFSTCADAL